MIISVVVLILCMYSAKLLKYCLNQTLHFNYLVQLTATIEVSDDFFRLTYLQA